MCSVCGLHLQGSNNLRPYIDMSRSKQLLSTALLAMRTQECPIPIFVEVAIRVRFDRRAFHRLLPFSAAIFRPAVSSAAEPSSFPPSIAAALIFAPTSSL